MFSKRLISFILLISLLAPSVAMPAISYAQSAEGAAVSTLFNCFIQSALGLAVASANFVQVPEVEGGNRAKEACMDSVASLMAKLALAYMTRSIVNWINSGFQGDPTFVSNPEKFFKDIANDISGEFIKGLGLEGLCDPLKPQIMIALAQLNEPPSFRCTLRDAVKNFDDFRKDFSKGGWAGWFQMTQYPQNNPYGLFAITVDAQNQLVNRALRLKSEELNQGQGFLSLRRCKEYEPNYEAAKKTAEEYRAQGGTYNLTATKNDGGIKGCAKAEVTTPGKMIVEAGIGVNKSPQEQLIAADELNESLAAVFNALIGQLVSQGFKSLSDKGKSTNTWFDSANESVKSLLASLEAAVAKLQAIVSNREASISIIETINAKINALLAECSEYLNTNYPGSGNPLSAGALEKRRNALVVLSNGYSAELAAYTNALSTVGDLLSSAQEIEADDASKQTASQLPDIQTIFSTFQNIAGQIPDDSVAQQTEADLIGYQDELKDIEGVYTACKAAQAPPPVAPPPTPA